MSDQEGCFIFKQYEITVQRVCVTPAFFLRQVPLHLPGGTRLVVDFLEFHADGTTHFVDAKGMKTEAFKIKKREIEAHYPITIELA
jgi:hypothetical protein